MSIVEHDMQLKRSTYEVLQILGVFYKYVKLSLDEYADSVGKCRCGWVVLNEELKQCLRGVKRHPFFIPFLKWWPKGGQIWNIKE